MIIEGKQAAIQIVAKATKSKGPENQTFFVSIKQEEISVELDNLVISSLERSKFLSDIKALKSSDGAPFLRLSFRGGWVVIAFSKTSVRAKFIKDDAGIMCKGFCDVQIKASRLKGVLAEVNELFE
jgi:hypothetical protein